MKATEQYFPVVVFVLFYKVGLSFDSVGVDFVTSEAWVRRLKAFSEGQKIPRTSLGKRLILSGLSIIL